MKGKRTGAQIKRNLYVNDESVLFVLTGLVAEGMAHSRFRAKEEEEGKRIYENICKRGKT